MITNRTVILLILIVAVGFATSLLMDVSEPDEEPGVQARNDPDIYMVNAEVTQFDKSGGIRHRINATRMTHFPLTDVTTLKVPNLHLYSAGRQAPWDIIASNGRLLPKVQLREEIVELWDQVLATREKAEGDFVNIQTDNLTVYPDRNYAETNTRVVIDNASGRTESAGGMKAYLDEGKFEFFSGGGERVRTVLAPKQGSEADGETPAR